MVKVKPQSKVEYRIKRWMKDIALDLMFPRSYRAAARACPDPQTVVFLETKESVMPVAMRHAYDRLVCETDFDVQFVTLRNTESSLSDYFKHCRNAVPVLARARCIFLCDSSDLVSALPLREETRVVQLWHACGAFKKWGMSTADSLFGESRADQLRHPFYGNLDLVTVSAPEVVWAYEEAMHLGAENGAPGVVQPVGVSSTDVYFDEGFQERSRRQLEEVVPQAVGKKVVFYAPTFRGRVRKAQGPDYLDVEELARTLGDEWVLVVRHHPYVSHPPAIPDHLAAFAVDVSGDARLSIEGLLCASDVLVTDYSSVVFEFSLFERPVCFFAPDRADYGDWRGFYYDYDELAPGPVFEDSASMAAWIADAPEQFDRARIQAFREKFMSACDGHATDRIFAFAFGEVPGRGATDANE
ncbi:MAG: CDP-glycerol glycerophosphotransferase family protein [Eggerthellaceae bacterium]|nr:CDP-glycerol glycerophosphotransferase family protein [Eggerthellaceae bacterium]